MSKDFDRFLALIWAGFGYVLAMFPYVKRDKNPPLTLPPPFPPPSGAWARSAGTLARVWVDRSVHHDRSFGKLRFVRHRSHCGLTLLTLAPHRVALPPLTPQDVLMARLCHPPLLRPFPRSALQASAVLRVLPEMLVHVCDFAADEARTRDTFCFPFV